MQKEYDFANAKRGPLAKAQGKTRITIYLDDAVINAFRQRAESAGIGYQTAINSALTEYLEKPSGKQELASVETMKEAIASLREAAKIFEDLNSAIKPRELSDRVRRGLSGVSRQLYSATGGLYSPAAAEFGRMEVYEVSLDEEVHRLLVTPDRVGKGEIPGRKRATRSRKSVHPTPKK